MSARKLNSFAETVQRRLQTLWVRQEGSATIEFVILFPLYLIVFASALETGILMTRQVMLERGVDIAMRSVRIGEMSPVDHDTLLDSICTHAGIIPSCHSEVRIEMQRVDLKDWAGLQNHADCVDRDDRAKPLQAFQAGGANELMIIRVCALLDTMFPKIGLGKQLSDEGEHPFAIISHSAFVIEPDK